MDRLWVPRIGSLRLAALESDPLTVLRMFDDIAVTPNRWGNLPSPATMKRIHAVFRGALAEGFHGRAAGRYGTKVAAYERARGEVGSPAATGRTTPHERGLFKIERETLRSLSF